MAAPTVVRAITIATPDATPQNSVNDVLNGVGGDALLVFAAMDHDAGNVPTVASVTFNGDALTLIDGFAVGSTHRCELWGMVAPDQVAAGSVVVTLSGGLSQEIAVGALLLTGVDQAAAFGIPAHAGATSAAPALNVTCDDTDDIVLACATSQTSVPSNTGGMVNQFARVANGATGQLACAEGDTLPGENDGSVAFAWTKPASNPWIAMGVAIHGVTAAGGGSPNLVGGVPI